MYSWKPWIVLFAALTLMLGFAGCGGDDGNGGVGGGTPRPEVGAGELSEAPIGPDGGRIEIPETDDLLPGVTLVVPPGAVSDETQFSVQAELADESERPVDLASSEPSFYLALVEYALDNTSAGAHPVYGPMLALSSAEFAGPGLLLGPDGAEFAAPVEVVMPISLLGLDDPSSALPVLRGPDGAWEIADDFGVDPAAGTATVRLSHFTPLKWVGNAASNLVTLVVTTWNTEEFERTVAEARNSLPQDTFERFVTGTVCADRAPSFDGQRIPDLFTLGDYLGFEVTRVESGQEDALANWIRDQFDPNNRNSHHVPLDDVFGKAMELNDGDVFQALVTAHNVLRDGRKSISIQGPLQDYRGDGGDETGARYHLFGVALYTFASEYWREQGVGLLGETILNPEVIVTAEEAIVSGTIFSDMKEYLVDLQGVDLGRELHGQVAGHNLEELAAAHGVTEQDCGTAGVSGAPGPDSAPDVELVEVRGSFDSASIAELMLGGPGGALPSESIGGIESNEVVLRFPVGGGEVTGEFSIAARVVRTMGPEQEDCNYIRSYSADEGMLQGTHDGQVLNGTATFSTSVQVLSGCDLLRFNPGSGPINWSGNFDGQQAAGAFVMAASGFELPFAASVPAAGNGGSP